ncbi:transporter substrate-binding domain-containing protein [Rhodococcus sp. NPDC004095]
MTRRRTAARRWGAVLVAVAAVVSGCATTAEPDSSEPSSTYLEPPLPTGAAIAASPTSTAPTPDCGDPTASLRPAPAGSTAPTPALDRIRARGRLLVGLDTSSNLFSFRNPATGTIEGFDVDIAHEVARDLFGDPDRIEFRILSSADRVAALDDRTVDVVVKTMTITCERRAKVGFSTVYYEAGQRVLAMKGSGIRDAADLSGRRVCAVAGTTNLQRIQQVQPEATVLSVPNWGDCLVVLQQRQVDAVTSDDSILAGLASQDPNLELVGPALSSEPYGIGVNKSDTDLVRQVNGTLERIRGDGTWQRIHNRWLGTIGPAPAPPTPHYED